MFTFAGGLIIGAVASGAACVLSSKYLGWFNKQVASLETKVKGE
jgi:hypothetical protein